MNSKIDWEPLHERVYRELKSAIMSARYPEGAKLTVRAVAADYGVSPMPVRAAFSRLVAEKAVEATASGTVVMPVMTQARFEELIELRVLLEGRAAEKAAACLTPEDLSELAAIAARLTKAAENDDPESYLDENRNFKFAIYRSVGSPTLLDLIERLWLQIGPFMRHYAKDVRFQLTIDRHETALVALLRRDGISARQAIEDDIVDGARYLRTVAGLSG